MIWRNKMKKILIMIMAVLMLAVTANALQPKGYISDENGDKHWYIQVTEKDSTYLSKLKNKELHVMTFKKPMEDTFINHMMITNIIKRWYGVDDCKFKEEPGAKCLFQKKGVCFQSENYKLIAFMLYYEIENNQIIKIYHAVGMAPCK